MRQRALIKDGATVRNSRMTIRKVLAIVALIGFVNIGAHAADLFWDGGTGNIGTDGDGASTGTAGTWDTTILNWDAGASPHVAWVNGNNDTAIFGGTAGTVTLGTDITVGGLTFSTASYTISGYSLTFGVAGIIDNSGTATITSDLAGGGAATITKQGNGTLQLNGANNYAGDTVISAGTLQIGNNTASSLGGGTYAGAISIASGAKLAIWSSANQILSGVISGDGSVEKAYGNTLTLSGNNTYTGKTSTNPQNTSGGNLSVESLNSVNGGTPLLASSSLGCPITEANGTIDIGSGGKRASCALIYTGAGETTDRIINLLFNSNSSQKITASGTGLLKFTSPFSSNANTGHTGQFLLDGTGDGEIVAALPTLPTGGLVKTGTGTWTLGGSVSANAVTVSGGSLVVSGSLTSATTVTVTSSGTLVIGAADALSTSTSLFLPSLSTANLTLNADQNLTVLPVVGGVQQPNGAYTSADTAWVSGSFTLTVGPVAALPLNWDLNGVTAGACVSGDTAAGTWDTSAKWNAAADGTGSTVAWIPGRTASFSAGTDATGAYTITVNGTPDVGGLTFEEGNVTLSGGTALRMVSDSVAYVASGLTVTNATPISDDGTPRSLTKSGAGTLVLAAANTYAGLTTVDAGTLQLSHSDAVANSAGIVLPSTSGTLTCDAASLTLSNLTFGFAATYTFPAGGTLNFLPGATIANADNRYDITITNAITGSPAVNIKDAGAKNTYLGFNFAPSSGTVTLGAVLNPDNTTVTSGYDKSGITLAGSTLNNSVASIDYVGGDQYADVNVQGGEWTVGDIRTGTVRLSGGTLIANGSVVGDYGNFVFTGGTLAGTGVVYEAVTVPATVGTIAPGDPTGTLTITNNNCTINGTLAITINGNQVSTLTVDPAQTLTISSATLAVDLQSSPSDPVIIATYGAGNLVGAFASNNLPAGWTIDYAANGGTAISLTGPPSGTVIMFR